MSFEIEIADKIEEMLKKDIFPEEHFVIRRDGRTLIPKERGLERHDIQLYVKDGPNPTARNMVNADAAVLNKQTNTVEMILEYELQTNPKDMTGNFFAPFAVDRFESKFSDDKNVYNLDKNKTLMLLIIWFPGKRDSSARGQASIEKGRIMRTKLIGMKDKLKGQLPVKDGDIIIGDNLKEIVEETLKSINRMKNDL